VWFTQLAFSVAAPLVLCILGSVWLRNHFDMGGWVVVCGVILGVGGAVSGLCSSLKSMKAVGDEDDKKKPPVSFNDHE
jgi:hypothetical protein